MDNNLVLGNVTPIQNSNGYAGIFKGVKVYDENYVKELITTISFLRCCINSGELLTDDEDAKILKLIRKNQI